MYDDTQLMSLNSMRRVGMSWHISIPIFQTLYKLKYTLLAITKSYVSSLNYTVNDVECQYNLIPFLACVHVFSISMYD